MRPKSNTLHVLFMAIILPPLIYSCSVERKIAKEFIRNDTTRSVLVIPPDYLFKTSLKEYESESAGSLNDYEIDSLLFENSLFLKYIDDSAFIAGYYNNFCSELTKLGFSLYEEDSLIWFLSGKPGAYILNIAQLEIEEYVMPVIEKQQFDDYLYYQSINLNAINVNSWIEFSQMNDDEKKKLFFSSLFATDEMDGYFRYNYFTGEVKFDYSVDTLLLQHVYELGELAGYLYAAYTFDYLMNLYIDARMAEERMQRSEIYYHYNREKKWLLPATDDQRFIPMEQD